MRPGLKTGLRLPSLKKPFNPYSKEIFLDDCVLSNLPNNVLTVGRWNHDRDRLARSGQDGQQNEYLLLLGTRKNYRLQLTYSIKKSLKPLKFSLFTTSSPLFQSLTLKHYWTHQSDGFLMWNKSDNSLIYNFGANNNSINNRFTAELSIFVDESNPLNLLNTLSINSTYPRAATPVVANSQNMSISNNDNIYFSISTQDAGHLFNKILVEVV
ncbi:hypothetical protein C7H19_23645 [Aphanothece hegewaldii CCALA 016]|uniref:Uncharacterized protein n=1 Tax=Aphanothece hegewaldii CCALA 016 TaxID=2107694 RepID=A0A2T1LR30_9CHRO|nr:hypothetical protein [Aphanothece hegewaldii]PSF30578.1 hypothetical protein C7H19_23645 [Aphanothece hegewaldii CCALA 016]